MSGASSRRPRVLVLDNHDSFTWNLVQSLEGLGAECHVHRSDGLDPEAALGLEPDGIVLSPGPFGPERTGICAPLIRRAGCPTLGVCSGMQVIAVVGGARVVPSGAPVHGKARPVLRGADPVELVAGLAGRCGTVWLDDAAGRRHLVAARPVLELVADRDGCRVTSPGGERELELGGELEALPPPPPDDPGLPTLWLGLYDAWIRGDADGWRWEGDVEAGREVGVGTGAARPAPEPASRIRARPDDGDFRDAVGRVVERIHAGELAMIVDLVRNDLGRVCRSGSVRVERFQGLMRLPGMFHTYARVGGRLRPEADADDLLRATFPPGSITGAPKIQAMTVAAGEELHARGPAMGAIGWIGAGGDLDLSVAIRTAVMGNGLVAYHVGCGIVADSDPEEELRESAIKARAFVEAVRGMAG